ncbi:MAG: hypothetical protein ACLFNO_03120 [Parcubacteria group bacterium]
MNTKKIILIASIIVVILLAAWLVYAMFTNNEDPDINREENNNVTNEEEGRISEDDSERAEIDRKNDIYNQAISSEDYSECNNLEDQDTKNTCITQIAINSSNLDLCQEIDDTEKLKYCKSRVYHKVAIANNNINNCSLIEDSFWHKSCLNKIIVASDYDENLCDEIVNFDDAKNCENIILFQQATETNNCDLLEGEIKAECESALNINENNEENNEDADAEETMTDAELKAMDSDQDGLNDYEELNIYNTDPNNADSDGDGYEDGEEVENGYDPLSA